MSAGKEVCPKEKDDSTCYLEYMNFDRQEDGFGSGCNKKRRVNVACLQETKWKGDKAKETTDGYKFYAGKNNAINGVVIVVDKDMKEKIVG